MDTITSSFAWTFFVCFVDVKRVHCFHFSQLQVADKAGEGIKLQVSSAWNSYTSYSSVPFVNLMQIFNDLTCFVTGAQLSSSFRKAAILNYVHPKLASLLYVIQVHFWWLLSHRERKKAVLSWTSSEEGETRVAWPSREECERVAAMSRPIPLGWSVLPPNLCGIPREKTDCQQSRFRHIKGSRRSLKYFVSCNTYCCVVSYQTSIEMTWYFPINAISTHKC